MKNTLFINNSKIKLFMKTKTIFAFFMIALFGLFLTGCQNDDSIFIDKQSDNKSEQSIIGQKMSQEEIDNILAQPIKVTDPEMLKELQFMRDQDMITSQFYEIIIRTFDNDEVIYPGCKEYFCDATNSREGIKNMMKDEEISGDIAARHRKHTNLFSPSGGTIILRVKIHGAPGIPTGVGVTSDWVTAINQAVSEWNALNYNVKFNVISAADNTNPSGYINVYRQSFTPTSWIARAELPQSAGAYGSYIQINSGYSGGTLSSSAKKFAIAHELGHNIGLRHTDTSDGSDVHSSISCYGSTSYTDPNSVFKSTISNSEPWIGFTTCDKTVLNFYWWSLA